MLGQWPGFFISSFGGSPLARVVNLTLALLSFVLDHRM